MGKIFYITGPSSSGKDTIFKHILEDRSLSLKTFVMYTTRPIRVGETEGVEYHFVKEEQLQQIEAAGKLIELRAYNTVHGIWKYFTVCDENIDLDKNDYLMIGVVESFKKTKEYFGKDKVIPIFIEVDEGVRLQRALDRERKQKHPKYQEMCRRYLADAEDFSREKIQEAGIERGFYNDDLNRCLKEIVAYIKEEQKRNGY